MEQKVKWYLSAVTSDMVHKTLALTNIQTDSLIYDKW